MISYPSNKGVGASLVIMGLSGVYIIIAIAALMGLFILAVVLSNTSIPIMGTILMVLIPGSLIMGIIYRLNRRLGLYGYMKWRMKWSMPPYLKNRIRIKNMIKQNRS